MSPPVQGPEAEDVVVGRGLQLGGALWRRWPLPLGRKRRRLRDGRRQRVRHRRVKCNGMPHTTTGHES